jgi:DNA-binding transcriptional MerR regulator
LNKAPDAFRTISEVADELDLPQHVLRFWESRFPHIRPMKRGGGRRYYRPEDIDLLRGIRHLLYGDGYTIRGVQRILREQGVRTVQSVGQGHAVKLPVPPKEDAQKQDGEPNGARGVPTILPPLFSGATGENGGGAKDQELDDSDDPDEVDESDEADEAEAADDDDEAQDGVDDDDADDSDESDDSAEPDMAPQKRPIAEAKSAAVPPAPKEPGAPPGRVALPQVAAPQPRKLAAEHLERLKHALAELEACRRMLDRANEEGR